MTTTGVAVNAGFPNRTLEFKYDYLGRRVQKRSLNQSAGTDTYRPYLYAGHSLVAEFDAPGGTSCGSLLKSYTWGLDLAGSLTATGGVGALVQITDHASSLAYFPTYDGNGNIAALLRASDGVAVAKYEYSPFGELLRCEGAHAKENPFRFSTKFTDDESGLVYYGARFYSPTLGRFINRDPIEEQGGLNLYGFSGNDSVNRVDYLGFQDLVPFVGSGPVDISGLNLPLTTVGAGPTQTPTTDPDGKRDTPIFVPVGGLIGHPSEVSAPTRTSRPASTERRVLTGSVPPVVAAPNSVEEDGSFPSVLAGTVRTGETNATIEGKAAHSAFGQGAKLSNDTITDRLTVGKNKVGVDELKPEGRLANTGKFNQAINQLYRQMAAAAEKFKGKTVEGSLWVWQKTGTGFKYVKVMTIKMGGGINGVLILPGVLSDVADMKEVRDRAAQNGRTYDQQLKLEMLERGPMLQTPYGSMPNPYWAQPINLNDPAELEAWTKGTTL
jgi:RHS repeat-associated protein